MLNIPRIIHRTLIKYDIYSTWALYKYFELTHPDYKPWYTIEDHNKFCEKTKQDLKTGLESQREREDRVINNLKAYCENYPSDILNHMYFMKEYRGHGYSYKITENFDTIVKYIGTDKKITPVQLEQTVNPVA